MARVYRGISHALEHNQSPLVGASYGASTAGDRVRVYSYISTHAEGRKCLRLCTDRHRL